MTQHVTVHPRIAQHNAALHSMAQHGTACHNASLHSMPQHGKHGTARYVLSSIALLQATEHANVVTLTSQ